MARRPRIRYTKKLTAEIWGKYQSGDCRSIDWSVTSPRWIYRWSQSNAPALLSAKILLPTYVHCGAPGFVERLCIEHEIVERVFVGTVVAADL